MFDNSVITVYLSRCNPCLAQIVMALVELTKAIIYLLTSSTPDSRFPWLMNWVDTGRTRQQLVRGKLNKEETQACKEIGVGVEGYKEKPTVTTVRAAGVVPRKNHL